MDHVAKNIIPIRIEDEMKNSYMDYSMSVIIGRALPASPERVSSRCAEDR